MSRTEAQVLRELVEAAQALHVADGQLGRRDVWRERWLRHQVAAAAAAQLLRERQARSRTATRSTP